MGPSLVEYFPETLCCLRLLTSSEDLTSFYEHQLYVRPAIRQKCRVWILPPLSLIIHPKGFGHPLFLFFIHAFFLIINLWTQKIYKTQTSPKYVTKILIICPSTSHPFPEKFIIDVCKSNYYAVHLKLIQCCMSIISQ